MSPIDYASTEVERKNFDLSKPDGVQRVSWMLRAWVYAIEKSADRQPNLYDVVNIGRTVEPKQNSYGFRHLRLDGRPTPDQIPKAVADLLNSDKKGWDFFKEFLRIRPFLYGNERAGSLLTNWRDGTLSEPRSVTDGRLDASSSDNGDRTSKVND